MLDIVLKIFGLKIDTMTKLALELEKIPDLKHMLANDMDGRDFAWW